MSVYTRQLKQWAVYWAPAAADEYGRPGFEEPVEIACRWEDGITEFVAPDASKQQSQCSARVATDLAVGGLLALGTLAAVVDSGFPVDPREGTGVKAIRQFTKTPGLKGVILTRVALM